MRSQNCARFCMRSLLMPELAARASVFLVLICWQRNIPDLES